MTRFEKQIYPRYIKPNKKKKSQWGVEYHLAFDEGGGHWTQYYRTKFGARLSAFLNVRILSSGGSALLFENKGES